MPKPQANAAQITERINKVYDLLLNGADRNNIIQYAAKVTDKKTDWQVSPRQIDNYIHKAKKAMEAHAAYHRGYELGRAIEALKRLFAVSMNATDYRTALSAQRELNTLLGLYAPPPAQTIKLLGLDPAEVEMLVEMLTARGMKPSDFFAAMMAEIASEANERTSE